MAEPSLVQQPAFTRKSIAVDTLSLQTIVAYAGGTLQGGPSGQLVNGLTTDSRAVGPGDLFVALKGDRFDGHQFVEQCARAGGSGAVVERNRIGTGLPADFSLIEVDDTLRAYQSVAAQYRRNLPLKVIGITGSNGKTSTKDLTAAVLDGHFRVLKTQGNLNNHIGVPQTLLRCTAKDQVAVLEMGMNHPGEIAPLAAMAQPDTAIITNIGSAHIEFMKTRLAIAQEKGTLAAAVGRSGHVVFPAEDDFAETIAQSTEANRVTVGFERGDLRAESVSGDLQGSRFVIVEESMREEANLPVPGRHMIVNALLAVAAGRIHGLSLSDCVRGLAAVQLTKGRLERKSVAGLQIIDDSYNANPDSMIAALQTLARMPTTGRRIAVLGRMGELGSFSEAGHRQVGDAVAHERVDCLIAVGTEAGQIADNARAGGLRDVITVADVAEAARRLLEVGRADDLILIKGSRSAAMESIITHLAEQSEPAAHSLP